MGTLKFYFIFKLVILMFWYLEEKILFKGQEFKNDDFSVLFDLICKPNYSLHFSAKPS